VREDARCIVDADARAIAAGLYRGAWGCMRNLRLIRHSSVIFSDSTTTIIIMRGAA
jgi:hypothetical protein